MLREEDAKRVDFSLNRTRVFIYDCLGCDKEIRVQRAALNHRTGYCVRCVKRRASRPYAQRYRRLLHSAQREGHAVEITYEQMEFLAEVGLCFYCGRQINWKPYSAGPYNLDRVNNEMGYTFENVVVCCKKCNFLRSNFYDCEEFKAVMKIHEIWASGSEDMKRDVWDFLISWTNKMEPD